MFIKQKKLIKTIAFALGALMLIALLSSAVFISACSEHHCTHSECAICAAVQKCMNMLGKAVYDPSHMTALLQGSALVTFFVLLSALVFFFANTPVLNKVRLND